MALSPIKRSHAEILLSWEVEGLKTYACEVLPYLEGRISENTEDLDDWIRQDGSLSERELLRSAYDVALFSVNERLNAIVDGMLLYAARGDEDVDLQEQVAAQNRSRTLLMRAIERAHNIRLRFFPGWNVIEKVRDDANATKHRLGTTLLYHNELGINELRTVKLTPNDVHERIEAVESWLREIIRVTKKARYDVKDVIEEGAPSNHRIEKDAAGPRLSPETLACRYPMTACRNRDRKRTLLAAPLTEAFS